MLCPKCGSNQVTSATITETNVENHQKGFGCIKACIGYVLFNVPGILCGLCGMGKGKVKATSNTRVEYTCQNCGHRF